MQKDIHQPLMEGGGCVDPEDNAPDPALDANNPALHMHDNKPQELPPALDNVDKSFYTHQLDSFETVRIENWREIKDNVDVNVDELE